MFFEVELHHCHQRTNHIFGNRYCATIIENKKHLINVIRYIYQNPVRAKLVSSVYDYVFSSLGFYSGQTNPRVRIAPDAYSKQLFNHGISGWEAWHRLITDSLPKDDLSQIRLRFKRFHFTFSKRQRLAIHPTKTSLQL